MKKRSPRQVAAELEAKRRRVAAEAAKLQAERKLRLLQAEARHRPPAEDKPVPELGASRGRQRRPEAGQWEGFKEHKRKMRALRRREARAARLRRMEVRVQRALRSLEQGEYVAPEHVAEVLCWAVGLR
mgnify:CR=1 FL=1